MTTSTARKPFHKRNPETGELQFFDKGDEVPEAIAAIVSDDAVSNRPASSTTGGDLDPSQFDSEAYDAAVSAGVAEQLEDRVNAAVQEQRDREAAQVDALADADEPFDPTADKVKASDVKDYLEGLDRDTVSGSREYDRVVQAERDGENRSTAFPKDDGDASTS